jgi:hypothetical protein
VLRRHLLSLFNEEEVHRVFRYRPPSDYRVNPDFNPDSFLIRAARYNGLVAARAREMRGQGADWFPDQFSYREAALTILRERWPQHLALTLSFAYRGAFVDGYFGVMHIHPVFQPFDTVRRGQRTIMGLLAMTFIPSLIGVAVYSLRKRQWALLALLLPALYSFAIHAVATHYIPRYSAPLVPVLVLALGVAVQGIAAALYARWRKRKTRSQTETMKAVQA